MAINFKTDITNIDENHRSVEFTVLQEEIEKLFQKNVSEFRKQVSMKGFKPGQVPKQLFISRFGDEVYNDTIEKIVHSDLKNEFERIVDTWKIDEKLEIAAPAENKDFQFERGQDLVYKLTIALNKPLQVQGYKELGITVPSIVVSEEEINDVIKGIRERFAKDVSVERASKLDDIVKGNYLKQVIDGAEKKLPENPYFELEISDEIDLEDLKNALIGVSANEEKEFTVNYPEDYPNEEFKGKSAVYKVAITDVCELELPAMDEEFYSKLGVKNEEDFRTRITDDILKDKKEKAKRLAINEAIEKLFGKNPFPVLEEQIRYTAERSLEQHNHKHGNHNEEESIKISDEDLNSMRGDIVHVIKEDRILRAIIEQESLKPTQAQVDARVQEIADSANMDFDSVKDIMRKNGQINRLRETLKIELAQNLLIGEVLPEKKQES